MATILTFGEEMIWALHGALGAASDWDFLGSEVQAVDLWSDFRALDYKSWAEDFCQEVLKSGDPSPVLLGYSMGGRLALHALLHAPRLWKKAVIVSAHTGLAESERPARAEVDAAWLRRLLAEPWQRFLDQWEAQPVLQGTQSIKRYHPAMRRCFEEWSLARQQDLLPHLRDITVPVHWLCGESDPKFRVLGERAVAVLPDAKLTIAAGVGHRVPWAWPTFAEYVAG